MNRDMQYISSFRILQNGIIRKMSTVHPPHHVPVLLDATLRELAPQKGESYLDLTAGYAGHASAVLNLHIITRIACWLIGMNMRSRIFNT